MKKFLLLTVVVCLAALSLPAQEGPPANLSRGYHIIVKQGHSAEFEAGFKMHVQWRKAHNDPWGWEVWQLDAGERLGRYVVISGGHKWADLDSYDVPGWFENWNVTAEPHIQQIDAWIDRLMLDGSRPPDALTDGAVAQVVVYRFRPGKQGQAMKAIREFTEAANQANWAQRYVFTTPEAGGSPGTITLVLLAPNWAGLEEPSPNSREMLSGVIGEEGAQKLVASWDEAAEMISEEIWRFRADMSHIPSGGM